MESRSENAENCVYVVSGLPRSGTSLMMQMLAAGGIEPLTDNVRMPDEDNPRGYFEYEAVKSLRTGKSWLPLAVGKVVKIVHTLLPELPAGFPYRVIFMRRRLEDVLESQRKMLERMGKMPPGIPAERMMAAFAHQIEGVEHWMGRQDNFRFLTVSFDELNRSSETEIGKIVDFCQLPLDPVKMRQQIDPALHRNRSAVRLNNS